MKQEQKPFEVMTGAVVLGQEYSFKIFAEGKTDLFAVSTAAKIIAKYAINANAEIRRLQQQLADAPTWGEWADATEEAHRSGAYDVEFEDGSSELHTRSDLQYMLKWPPVENSVKRFRRLNYEPKPAREVEKKYDIAFYDMSSGEVKIHPHTAQELAGGEVNVVGEAELARDLLAAQERIRELEGKQW